MIKKGKWIVFGLGILLVAGVIMLNFRRQDEGLRFVSSLGNGINLGNSLDSTNLKEYDPQASDLDYEVFWGNPQITEEQFKAISEAGFESVRIPVTWEEHMDEEGNISNVWMERVTEVVDMALAQNLYVILDTHHEDWLDLDVSREDEICTLYEKVWEQIAENFLDYNEHLLFEGMNEPRLRNSEHEWDAGTSELRSMVNKLNVAFVETVRRTGGNNESRYLLISPYATHAETEALEELVVPKGNIIVSVHMYAPYFFCQDDAGTADWNLENSADCEEIERTFSDLKRLFINRNIPVIITEFGCKDKNNQEARAQWIIFYREIADKAGIPCMWWDDGSGYKILDRQSNGWVHEELVELLTK